MWVGRGNEMPELSRFYGIVITIYFNDHAPPHFHAKYAGRKAKIAIATGDFIQGALPRRAQLLINEWRVLHQHELDEAWRNITTHQPFTAIDPLE